jgi:hypothetical protein
MYVAMVKSGTSRFMMLQASSKNSDPIAPMYACSLVDSYDKEKLLFYA